MTGTTQKSLALVMLVAGIVLMALTGLPCAAQNDSPTLAPENPAFLEYLKDPYVLLQQEADSGLVSGIVPDPIDFSYLKDIVGGSNIVTAAVLPSSYDLRTLGRVTPVRNQGGCGSCWSFATYGSLESNLMPSQSLNLSENNLKNKHGFDLSCCSGGNRSMSTAYLARWEGAISETDDPYNQSSCTSPTGVKPIVHVQDVVFIPTRSGYLDNDALKQAVMTYGGLYTAYYHSDAYYNSSTGAYYFSGSSQSNHGVTIIGWDDNFDKSKFRTPPPGNGAFLIKNSWGSAWGLSGYFWISYYDTQLASENGAFIGEPAGNYDGIYQYDTLGWTSSTGYGSNTAWFANVFTASSGSKVAAASFYTPAPNSSYEVSVYLSPTSGPISSSGPAATTTGTISTVGYHTVKIPTPVSISSGQKFSVVVKLTTPGYGYPICLERPYSGFASKAIASTGQSYMSSNGTSWSDVAAQYSNTNVCLKAFTSGASGPAPGVLSITPATGLTAGGPAGGPFSPSSQAYTLTNSGGTALDWTASKTKSWVSLSATSGKLAAGESTTVTAALTSDANTLTAGSYSDTVTFTDTTNSKTTTRDVALTVQGPGSLSISPTTVFSSSGIVGGPFSPSSRQYTLSNPGATSIGWTASVTKPWVTLSSTSGTLAAGASTTVTLTINSNANTLSEGSYSDTVTFVNTTNGAGNTTRDIVLTVNATPPPGVLSVSPATGLTASGTAGGPFSPSSQTCTVTNTGGQSLNWTVGTTQSWVSRSTSGGTLAAGASASVTISINSAANSLATGSYSDVMSFTNTTSGSGNTSRTVSLTVNEPAPVTGYEVKPTTFSWIDPSSHSLIYMRNNSVSPQSIPFAFEFYGKTCNSLSIGANGLIGFTGTSGLYTGYNTNLPTTSTPNGALYPYWDQLNLSAAQVRVGVVGTAPNRRMVISWIGASHYYSSATKFTFQAILCEGTNEIIFQYLDSGAANYIYGGGRSATIGIENANGTEACVYSCNTRSLANNQALIFSNHGSAPTPGTLSVTPSSGLNSSGSEGGPFSPSSLTYTLTNTGGQALDWTALVDASWVSLSSAAGSLDAGASTTLVASINSAANSLSAGAYTGKIDFTNTTNGNGDTSSDMRLTVNGPTPPGALAVTPSAGLTASGTAGGPFSPSSQTYTLSNTGGQPVTWTAGATQPWVTASPSGGTLAAGASTSVTVSINSAANGLAAGSYSDTVSFINTTNGTGNTTRPVSLTVNEPAPDPEPVTGYQAKATGFAWINPASHSTVSLGSNSVSYPQNIPFSFDLYGTSYNRLYIGANGMIGFAGTSGMYSGYNTNLPTVTTPNGAVYAYWDQLNLSGGQVKVGVVGSAPNRRMVISWVNVAHYYSSTTKFTFQVILCEGSNNIITQYLASGSSNYAYGGGRSATIGIESADGKDACVYSCNTRSISDRTAVLFTRNATQSKYQLPWSHR